ncbi:MAG TPA: cupin domain-containing protein [Bryobacteraceae bacterium]|jgi:mannose-6-phosphate isomerase-like protein (cupin superfamily)|nr:cupin domain-containing protein [Bryobacteraceae bacterium]
MKTFGIGLTLTLLAGAIVAQRPAPPPEKTYTSAADITAMMAKAKATRKPDQANLIQNILRLNPISANLEYRGAVGPAAVHEKEAELFYVIDGSGTLVTGGKLANEKRTNADNLSGDAIEGGKGQPVAKGDFMLVPEGTPHWFSPVNGTLVLMSVHIPHTAGK